MFDRYGIRNENGSWVLSLTTFGDTVAPPQPQSLQVTQGPGAGAQARVTVTPTSCADLWGHLFYRHTANSYTLATTVGFGSTMFLDTGITYETSYFYWAAPIDASFNVGSYVGPVSFVASRIVTNDIASDSATRISRYQQPRNGSLNFNAALQWIGSLSIITRGGPIVTHGNFYFTNGSGNKRTIQLSLWNSTDPTNPTSQIDVAQLTVNGNDDGALSVMTVDSVAAGTWYYSLGVAADAGTNHTARNIDIVAFELLR